MCSAPFPLFARIIFPPIFSGADLRSAALFVRMHDVERACSTLAAANLLYGNSATKFRKSLKETLNCFNRRPRPRSFVLVTAINVRFFFVNIIMGAVLGSDAGAGSAESVASASHWAWESELS